MSCSLTASFLLYLDRKKCLVNSLYLFCSVTHRISGDVVDWRRPEQQSFMIGENDAHYLRPVAFRIRVSSIKKFMPCLPFSVAKVDACTHSKT